MATIIFLVLLLILNLLNKRFLIAEHIYQVMVKEARKRLYRYYKNTKIIAILSKYKTKTPLTKLDKQDLKELQLYYGLSENQYQKYLKKQLQLFKNHMDSTAIKKIASTVWKATSSVLYKKGEKIKYKKHNTIKSIEGKSNKTGIRYINNSLCWNGMKVNVFTKKNTYYNNYLVKENISFCRLVRFKNKNNWKYRLQLIIKGELKNKHICIKNSKVGIDIGVDFIAVVSKEGIIHHKKYEHIKKIEHQILQTQRKLDFKKRIHNPNNYKEDNTYKKGKQHWFFTKAMIRCKQKKQWLQAKRARILKMQQEILTNKILALGNEFIIEPMDFNELKLRKEQPKSNKKKRYGKAIGAYAPAQLIEILNRKLSYQSLEIKEVNQYKFKASQYHHDIDTYIKHDITDRIKIINGVAIDRDIYSAYLLSNSNEDLETINREECIKGFAHLLKQL